VDLVSQRKGERGYRTPTCKFWWFGGWGFKNQEKSPHWGGKCFFGFVWVWFLFFFLGGGANQGKNQKKEKKRNLGWGGGNPKTNQGGFLFDPLREKWGESGGGPKHKENAKSSGGSWTEQKSQQITGTQETS